FYVCLDLRVEGVEDLRDPPLLREIVCGNEKTIEKFGGNATLARRSDHHRGCRTSQRTGPGPVIDEARVGAAAGPENMKFCTSLSDLAVKPGTEGSLTVFQARSDLREEHISIAKRRRSRREGGAHALSNVEKPSVF